MKLVSVDDLKGRLRLVCPNDPLNVSNVERAIVAATSHIAAIMRTEFDQRTVEDTWFISRDEFAHNNQRLDLYMSQAFNDDSQPIEVRMACTLKDLDDAASVVDPADATFRIQGGHRGIFQFFGCPHIGSLHHHGHGHSSGLSSPNLHGKYYLRLQYLAGFKEVTADEGNEKIFKQKQVPDWLKEVAIQLSVEIFKVDGEADTSQRTGAQRTSGVKRKTEQFLTTAENLLAAKIRAIPQAQRPFMSDEV